MGLRYKDKRAYTVRYCFSTNGTNRSIYSATKYVSMFIKLLSFETIQGE